MTDFITATGPICPQGKGLYRHVHTPGGRDLGSCFRSLPITALFLNLYLTPNVMPSSPMTLHTTYVF